MELNWLIIFFAKTHFEKSYALGITNIWVSKENMKYIQFLKLTLYNLGLVQSFFVPSFTMGF